MYDTIIVGGGPAGLTAAIYLRRANKSCAVFEKDFTGGMINNSAKVENIPGFTEISGPDFSEKLTEQAEELGAEIIYKKVISVKFIEIDNIYEVITDSDTSYLSKSVIIATGTKHRTLGVPGEEKLIGNGVHFCALCDGAFYRDKCVIVIGGGNSALTEALYLSELSEKVTILQNLPELTGDEILQNRIKEKTNIEVITSCNNLNYMALNNDLLGMSYTDKNDQICMAYCDGVFLAIGMICSEDITNGIVWYRDGYMEKALSSGMYIAGDCSFDTEVKQVVTACGSGATAATRAIYYINNFNLTEENKH